MQSPFAIFRKHQRGAMVVLTLMAMFAFVFLDRLNRGSGSGRAAASEVAVETNTGDLTFAELENLANSRRIANRFATSAFLQTHEQLAGLAQQFPQLVEDRLRSMQFGYGLETAGPQGLHRDVLFSYLLRKEG